MRYLLGHDPASPQIFHLGFLLGEGTVGATSTQQLS